MQPSGALLLLIVPSEEGRGCWQTGGGVERAVGISTRG